MRKKISWQLQHRFPVTSVAAFQQVLLANRGWQKADLHREWQIDTLTSEQLGLDEQQVASAVKRISHAHKHKEKVVIFGDYDVDGNCATAIMWRTLREIGLIATPFIPHRLKHGYGMSVQALEDIMREQKPDLIITVDNGITAKQALEFCQQHGIDVIVTDHHQADGQVVPAVAVVATRQLSGAGVAWWLSYQLLTQFKPKQASALAQDLLDLVALATIVDQVPLVGWNRHIVSAGINQLRHSQRAGIVALTRQAHAKQEQLTTQDIGFGLGPRINAIGRLTNTLEALRLLCTDKPFQAQRLATSLTDVNQQRQTLTSEMVELALAQVDEKTLPKVIVVASPEFHEGIIGLIASKLVDRYYRPALVIGIGKDIAKGSARSITGLNITDLLRECRELLLDVGGHAAAAGCSLLPANIEALQKMMTQKADKLLRDDDLQPRLIIETPVTIELLKDAACLSLLEALEPCGNGNPPPVVQIEGRVQHCQMMGAEKQHLKIYVGDSRQSLSVLFWHYGDKDITVPALGSKIKVAGRLTIDNWQQREIVMIGEDWQACRTRKNKSAGRPPENRRKE